MRAKTGQVLIELAIVLPLLVLLLLGIIDYGRAMYTKNTLNNAARAAARAAAVMPSPLNLPESAGNLSSLSTPLQGVLINNLTNGIDAAKVSYRVERIDGSGNPVKVAGMAVAGEQVKVTLSWPNFPTFLPHTLNLEGTASMRYER